MKKLIGLLGLSVLVFAASGCSGSKNNAEIDNRTAVYVQKIQMSDIADGAVYSGTVNAYQSVDLFPEIPAKVEEIYANVGDIVNEGDILCKLYTTDIENSFNAASASYQAAVANAEAARIAYETANGSGMQMQIANAEVSLANAEIQYNNAKTNYENNIVLFEAGAVSQIAMDQCEDAYLQAEKAYEAAKIAYDVTVNIMPEENEKKAKAAYESAVANANAAKVQLANAEQALSDTELKAPISGVVAFNNLNIGEETPSGTPSFTIIQTDTMKINVSVSEKIINKINPGDEVDIKVTSVSNDYIKGVIHTVSPAATVSGTYPVEVFVENTDGLLKAGMFGEIHFTTESSEKTISLPRNTVIEKNGEKYVFVEKDGVVEKRIVTTGIDTGEQIEITSGIKVNEYVVTKGQTYLSDGEEVLVSNSGEEVK